MEQQTQTQQSHYTPPVELNYNPEEKNTIFSIPDQRALELVEQWAKVCRNVLLNFQDYRILGTGKNEGKYRLDDGKILKEFIACTHNINEWAFCLYSATGLFGTIREFRHYKENELIDLIAALVGK